MHTQTQTAIEQVEISNQDHHDTETWKKIIGYEKFYEISNKGNVRSLDYSYTCSNGKVNRKRARTLKTNISNVGYKYIDLISYGVRKKFLIHRLVASHFCPNPTNKNVVNHIDSDRLNNNFLNLEWVTYNENAQHAMAFSDKVRLKLTKKQVVEIINSPMSHRKLAKLFNVGKTLIGAIKRGEQYGFYSGVYSETKYNGQHYVQIKQQQNRMINSKTQVKLF